MIVYLLLLFASPFLLVLRKIIIYIRHLHMYSAHMIRRNKRASIVSLYKISDLFRNRFHHSKKKVLSFRENRKDMTLLIIIVILCDKIRTIESRF